MTTEEIITPITPEAEQVHTDAPQPPWIYKDGYDQHYKVRYLGFTIDLDEWIELTKR